MADVLQMGWWWLPGEKQDDMLAKMKEAAEKGGNLEILGAIIRSEDDKLSGKDKIEFMRDKQIPLLEKLGSPSALAQEWFWLGYALRQEGWIDEALAAYHKVLEIVPPTDLFYGNAKAAIDCESWARELDSKLIRFFLQMEKNTAS